MQIDFTPAVQLIHRAQDLMDAHEGKTFRPDVQTGPGRRNDPELATVTRELIEICELLRCAASEVQMQFFELKGKPDPRKAQN